MTKPSKFSAVRSVAAPVHTKHCTVMSLHTHGAEVRTCLFEAERVAAGLARVVNPFPPIFIYASARPEKLARVPLDLRAVPCFIARMRPLIEISTLILRVPRNCLILSFHTVPKENPMKFKPLHDLSLIHISEPTRRTPISYAVFC